MMCGDPGVKFTEGLLEVSLNAVIEDVTILAKNQVAE
jgi:hypothetical protein